MTTLGNSDDGIQTKETMTMIIMWMHQEQKALSFLVAFRSRASASGNCSRQASKPASYQVSNSTQLSSSQLRKKGTSSSCNGFYCSMQISVHDDNDAWVVQLWCKNMQKTFATAVAAASVCSCDTVMHTANEKSVTFGANKGKWQVRIAAGAQAALADSKIELMQCAYFGICQFLSSSPVLATGMQEKHESQMIVCIWLCARPQWKNTACNQAIWKAWGLATSPSFTKSCYRWCCFCCCFSVSDRKNLNNQISHTFCAFNTGQQSSGIQLFGFKNRKFEKTIGISNFVRWFGKKAVNANKNELIGFIPFCFRLSIALARSLSSPFLCSPISPIKLSLHIF